MSELLQSEYWPYIVGGSVALLTTVLLIRKLKGSPRTQWPRDKVIIHQIGRGPWAPSLSPYPLKLETYMRMAKIPHEVDHKSGMSKKSKTPWITYNNDDVADSHFCIEYLNEKFNVDLNSHLTAEQKAIGRAFQTLVEDNLYWVIVCGRWLYMDTRVFKNLIRNMIPWFVPHWFIKKLVVKQTHAQGMSRHSPDEVRHVSELDIHALKAFLGNKKFLFGERPCEFDCTVFGMLAQLLWHMPGSPQETYMKEKCPNLVEYCERMKTTYWPDWDECITHGHTRPAAK